MKCSFCGEEVPAGRGKMLVRISGQKIVFCGSKCQRNSKLGRDGKSMKWTKTFSEFKGK